MRATRVMLMDYGVGNIHSLAKALAAAGATVEVTTDPLAALAGSAMVLPGVGAFEPATETLARERTAMGRRILEGYPTLGICLGMQLLFRGSDEGSGEGIGVFDGRVTRLATPRTPQMGWNDVVDASDALLEWSGLREVYYANSFACRPVNEGVVTAWSRHEGDRFPAVVREGNAVGVQFHPEKSSAAGLRFLRAWLEEAHP